MSQDPTPARSGGENPTGAGAAGDDSRSPHDAVGAFVLDALPEAERVEFEAHAAGCGVCRRGVAELAPVAALLPRLLEVAPEYEGWVAGGNGDAALPSPSAALRERLLAAARADRDPDIGAAPTVAAGTGPQGVPPVEVAGRGGAAGGASVAPVIPLRRTTRFGGGWPVAAALALVAAGSVAWGMAMQGRVADRDAELAARRTEVAAVRATSARAIALAPTADGPSGAWGDLYYDAADRRAMLHVGDLPVLPKDRAYQLWMLKEGEPVPSETFAVDAAGEKLMAMEADLSAYDAVALTVEPAGGSPAPTTPPILKAEMSIG